MALKRYQLKDGGHSVQPQQHNITTHFYFFHFSLSLLLFIFSHLLFIYSIYLQTHIYASCFSFFIFKKEKKPPPKPEKKTQRTPNQYIKR
jgi:hypothetical protein